MQITILKSDDLLAKWKIDHFCHFKQGTGRWEVFQLPPCVVMQCFHPIWCQRVARFRWKIAWQQLTQIWVVVFYLQQWKTLIFLSYSRNSFSNWCVKIKEHTLRISKNVWKTEFFYNKRCNQKGVELRMHMRKDNTH